MARTIAHGVLASQTPQWRINGAIATLVNSVNLARQLCHGVGNKCLMKCRFDCYSLRAAAPVLLLIVADG